MISVNAQIQQAEKKWLPAIDRFLVALYEGFHLPSHDIAHHYRVWKYAKQLLSTLCLNSKIADFTTEQTLVACLFHDTGLTVDMSEKHGHESKVICEQFLKQNPNLLLLNAQMVLSAIEHHDNKSLKNQSSISSTFSLVDIVSVADDLDAFGLVGVFRYIEIYSLRGIPVQDMAAKVLPNLENRFANFIMLFRNYPPIIEYHRARFEAAKEFFLEMNLASCFKVRYKIYNYLGVAKFKSS